MFLRSCFQLLRLTTGKLHNFTFLLFAYFFYKMTYFTVTF